MDELFRRIDAFNANQKNPVIVYGGDGSILNAIRNTHGKRAILPFRNYGLCERHSGRILSFLDGNGSKDQMKELKLSRCQFVEYRVGETGIDRGISEITLKNADMTKALRFNVYVNDRICMKNVIADGCVISTPYGSTGYWKSISRCVFKCNAIGVGFIAPSQGICNTMLDTASRICIESVRDTTAVIGADNCSRQIEFAAGEKVEVGMVPDAVSIFGLDIFHCQDCRAGRHAIIEEGIPVEDKYDI